MKTWYIIDNDKQIITLQAEREPSWFAWGGQSGWSDTPLTAVQLRLEHLACEIRTTEAKARDARDRLAAFEAAVPGILSAADYQGFQATEGTNGGADHAD